MKPKKQRSTTTIRFDRDILLALRVKRATQNITVDDQVNEAVRKALRLPLKQTGATQ